MQNMLYGDTVNVLRREGKRDKYGDLPEAELHHEITNVGIFYGGSEQANGGPIDFRRAVETDVVLYMKLGADILASDHVELPDGVTYKVNGKPVPSGRNPITGYRTNQIIVQLKVIEG